MFAQHLVIVHGNAICVFLSLSFSHFHSLSFWLSVFPYGIYKKHILEFAKFSRIKLDRQLLKILSVSPFATHTPSTEARTHTVHTYTTQQTVSSEF